MMSELFGDTYRIPSSRLQGWDYRYGSYFVTICIDNHDAYFGKVVNGNVILNTLGKIAHDFWSKIPNHFKNAQLDEFIIMPNHIHGILVLNDNNVETPHGASRRNNDLNREMFDKDNDLNRETRRVVSLPFENDQSVKNVFSPQDTKSLGYIINQFKGSVTREINRQIVLGTITLPFNEKFKRQARFYEHIVRDEKDLHRIRNYIINNPLKRDNDEYHI